jgi:hypothetical protein
VSLAITGLVAAYAILAVLLLSLNLTSLWRWWVKAGAIIVTTAFFGITFYSLDSLMGWPTTQKLPSRFSLVSSLIAQPNRKANLPGHIYLWVDTLDVNNVPSGRPRSYQLAYSDGFARKISEAQEKLNRGQDVMGVVSDREPQPGDPRSDLKLGHMRDSKNPQSVGTDAVPFREDGADISFEDLPPVTLPEKGPL